MRVALVATVVALFAAPVIAQAPVLTDEAREFFSNVVQHAYDLGLAQGRAEERVKCGRVL